MSLEFTFKHPADVVFDLLCDPDFLVERSIAIGELSADAEVEEDDSGKITVRMRREVKQELPAFLAKLFSPQQTITMTDEWRLVGSNYVGKGDFEVVGQPVNVKTEMTLKPQGNGCVLSIKYKPTAKIPLIGGKVEKFIEGNCEEGSLKEMKYAEARLG